MRKNIRRIFSIILAAILLLCASLPVFAKSEKCSCGTPPVIYVAALGSAKLYLDRGTENERLLFRPDTAAYLRLAARLAPAIARLAIDKNYDAFGDALIDGVRGVFGDLQMDENGDSTDRVTSDAELPDDPDHGVDKSYYFAYDFREDPLTVADKLHEYIACVKKLTGHDTVLLRASSMGGVMTMAYFYKYGTDGIDACIFQCCPILGPQVAGDLFTKKITIDPDALVRYASQLPTDEQWQSDLLGVVLDMLNFAGVFKALVGVADKLLENLTDRVFDELMYPVFGSMPGIWSFVTDDEYEQAKKMTFNENTSKKLISRLDEYHYNVQCKAGEILNKAKKDGVKIMIVAGYNKQRTPLVESYMSNSDAIDASTCLLPENTWFIKDMLHCKIHDGHKAMYNWFFYSESQPDVWSNEKYPQFLQNDVNAKTLTPIGTQARPAASNGGSDSSKESLTPQTGSASFAAVIPLLFALPAGVVSRRRKRS